MKSVPAKKKSIVIDLRKPIYDLGPTTASYYRDFFIRRYDKFGVELDAAKAMEYDLIHLAQLDGRFPRGDDMVWKIQGYGVPRTSPD